MSLQMNPSSAQHVYRHLYCLPCQYHLLYRLLYRQLYCLQQSSAWSGDCQVARMLRYRPTHHQLLLLLAHTPLAAAAAAAAAAFL
jgi:hypothetical protein